MYIQEIHDAKSHNIRPGMAVLMAGRLCVREMGTWGILDIALMPDADAIAAGKPRAGGLVDRRVAQHHASDMITSASTAVLMAQISRE